VIKKSEIINKSEWNAIIKNLPGISILQTWEWGAVKSKYGWRPEHYIWQDKSGKINAAALILIREISVPVISKKLRTIYIPQGPLLDWSNISLRGKVLDDIREFAKDKDALLIKIDPEIIYGIGEHLDNADRKFLFAQEIIDELKTEGWLFSPQQIQFKNTAWIRLGKSENELLAVMKQKTRYNIRLAGRKGVRIKEGGIDDLDRLYQMYLETSIRDGFIIRPKEYYIDVWSKFIKAEMAMPLIAEVDEEVVAGLLLFHFGNRSWYLYGMSTGKHREKMPNYLLQWEAIKLSKKFGCSIYDLWGAPDNFDNQDRMWGVYRFKKGLGCEVIQRIGAYDYPLSEITYKIFNKYVPRFLSITRKIRKGQQIQELE
jgi:lipid II:glycine glycyltransferase (peptidoglycan interpeptide bridge formation enzyme)